MKKKTAVGLIVLLLVLSAAMTGCGRGDAGVRRLNDDLYNDTHDLEDIIDDIGDDAEDMGDDIMDDADRLGRDFKDGTEDMLDGKDKNHKTDMKNNTTGN